MPTPRRAPSQPAPPGAPATSPEITAKAPRPQDEAKRCKLLEAALSVFSRYGFRKTSMDEVARAAQLSRQGLYLHFPNKEELFRATVRNVIETSSAAATEALAAPGPLETRLVRAFDEWLGRFVGTIGSGAEDLVEAGDSLAEGIVTRHKEQFVEAVAKAIRGAGLVAAYKGAGLNARQLAETLVATAHGLKMGAKSRQEFVERFTLAALMACAPLRDS